MALAAEIAGATAAALLDLDVDPVRAGRARRATPARGDRRASNCPACAAAGAAAGRPAARAPKRLDRADRRAGADAGAGGDAGGGRGQHHRRGAAPGGGVGAPMTGCGRYADKRLRPALVDELLRVTAPTPLLPRVAAAGARVGRAARCARGPADAGRPARRGRAPARSRPGRPGAGPHWRSWSSARGRTPARAPGWPGSNSADLLAALAPHRPVVVRARADRRSALPGWRSLTVGRAVRPGRDEDRGHRGERLLRRRWWPGWPPRPGPTCVCLGRRPGPGRAARPLGRHRRRARPGRSRRGAAPGGGGRRPAARPAHRGGLPAVNVDGTRRLLDAPRRAPGRLGEQRQRLSAPGAVRTRG